MQILSAADVHRALPMSECVEVMAAALRARAEGLVEQPLRKVFTPSATNAFGVWMPAYRGGEHAIFGTKLLCIVPDNPGRGMDTHQGAVILFDGVTGEPLAFLNASAITEIRTAAVSALATRLLARENAETLAIIGAGVQAEAHLRAIPLVRDIKEARVFSPRSAPALVERMDVAFDLKAVGSAEQAVRDADIVVTVTTSKEPVVQRDWLSPGTHVNAVGASTVHHQEVDTRTAKAAELYVDAMQSVQGEAKEFQIDPPDVRGELGDLLIGKATGRSGPDAITMFRSLGIATEDLYAADHVLRRAAELGVGVDVPL
ncbi:ornithine cyclodeaminase family protein [Kibdelosporangium persicum]|uniref:Ornithine cyclodeaminase n=1 Tax=Kibdelosporangium persicum TaxID=2698649 RepID=A0ABX2FEJ2_9PSEU|nr:ornithine cyclodeaminase family protein [Kibdelosporangium persicum]NRN69806.1 Ornithine cyclodeaminase [Kibdelosporangium persicum]